MKLAYYSTRRDGRGGWMQLDLRSGWSRLAHRQPDRGIYRAGHGVGQSRRNARPGAGSGHIGQSGGPRHQACAPPNPQLLDAREGAEMTDLLQVRDLHVRFAAPGGFIRAVTGVSFRVRPQSIVALVGESGSGKSVVSQTILRILPRSGDHHHSGEVLFADPAARRPGRRHRATAQRQRGNAGHPRRPDLDHLSGADDLAVAAAHDRQSGRRGAAAASAGHRARRRTS